MPYTTIISQRTNYGIKWDNFRKLNKETLSKTEKMEVEKKLNKLFIVTTNPYNNLLLYSMNYMLVRGI